MTHLGPANRSIAGQRLVPGEHMPLAGPFGTNGDSAQTSFLCSWERDVPFQGHDAERVRSQSGAARTISILASKWSLQRGS